MNLPFKMEWEVFTPVPTKHKLTQEIYSGPTWDLPEFYLGPTRVLPRTYSVPTRETYPGPTRVLPGTYPGTTQDLPGSHPVPIRVLPRIPTRALRNTGRIPGRINFQGRFRFSWHVTRDATLGPGLIFVLCVQLLLIIFHKEPIHS